MSVGPRNEAVGVEKGYGQAGDRFHGRLFRDASRLRRSSRGFSGRLVNASIKPRGDCPVRGFLLYSGFQSEGLSRHDGALYFSMGHVYRQKK